MSKVRRKQSILLHLLMAFVFAAQTPKKEPAESVQTKETPTASAIVDKVLHTDPGVAQAKQACHRRNTGLLREYGHQVEHLPTVYGKPLTAAEWQLFLDIILFVDTSDQKTIADSHMTVPKSEILRRHQELEDISDFDEKKTAMKELYQTCFKPPRALRSYIFTSAKQRSPLDQFSLSKYREMLNGILLIWPNLLKRSVCEEDETHSLVNLRHTFVVSGGRFREMYYWDSYWMFKGLLLSGQEEVVADSKKNFIDMINRFGLIPNANRWYYVNRSQPPYFIQMLVDSKQALDALAADAQAQLLDENRNIKASVRREIEQLKRPEPITPPAQKAKAAKAAKQATDAVAGPLPQPKCAEHPSDLSLYASVTLSDDELASAEKEYAFWETHRSVRVRVKEGSEYQTHELFKYGSQTATPRPEMLRYDLEDGYMFSSFFPGAKPEEYYQHIVAATESGWDFSKRWREYYPKEKMYGFLKTNSVVPVDLNSILVKNLRLLVDQFERRGNHQKAQLYQHKAAARAKAIDAVLWDAERGRWRDVFLAPVKNTKSDSDTASDDESSGDRDADELSTSELGRDSEYESGHESGHESRAKLYEAVRKQDDAFYLSDLYPLFMDIAADPDNRIFFGCEQFLWMEKLFLPKTSSHQYVKRTETEAAPCREISSISKRDILRGQDERNDQWDSDNVWPPLVHLVVEYLIRSKNISRATLVSKTYLDITDNYFKTFQALPEKLVFSATLTGEYEVQQGFGWSNSVAQWMHHIFLEYINDCP